MKNFSLDRCRILDLPKITDSRGNLTFVEGDRHIPFDIKRAYYLYGVPGGAEREDHNHTYIGHAANNLGTLRRIVLNLLKIDQTNTRSLPKKRRHAMLDLTYRDTLLSLA